MSGRILIVDDEKAHAARAARPALEGGLPGRDRVAAARRRCARIETGSFHVVITDLSMDGISGMQVLERARASIPTSPSS